MKKVAFRQNSSKVVISSILVKWPRLGKCRREGAVWMAKSVGTLVKRETTLKGIRVC